MSVLPKAALSWGNASSLWALLLIPPGILGAWEAMTQTQGVAAGAPGVLRSMGYWSHYALVMERISLKARIYSLCLAWQGQFGIVRNK